MAIVQFFDERLHDLLDLALTVNFDVKKKIKDEKRQLMIKSSFETLGEPQL